MSPAAPIRKVLVIEDEPAIRNVLYALLAGLGCEGTAAYSGQQALSMIRRENYDAVLLDLRCFNLPTQEIVSQIRDLRPNLVGRVLVITGDVQDSETLDMIEHHCLPHISQNRITQDLWGRLKTLLGFAHSPKTEP